LACSLEEMIANRNIKVTGNKNMDWSNSSEGLVSARKESLYRRLSDPHRPSSFDEASAPLTEATKSNKAAEKQIREATGHAPKKSPKSTARRIKFRSSLHDSLPDISELSWLPPPPPEEKNEKLMASSAHSARRRRVSTVVQSRQKAFTPSMEDSSDVSVDDEKKNPVKRRVSAAVSSNPFVDGSISNHDNTSQSERFRPSNWLVTSRIKDTERRASMQMMSRSERPSTTRGRTTPLNNSFAFQDSFNSSLNSTSEFAQSEELSEELSSSKQEQAAADTHVIATLTDLPTASTDDFASGRKNEIFEDIYVLGDLLGEGAYGEVFSCTHKESKAERAVKIIPKERMMEWQYDDVIKEFQMLNTIDTPNVIRVYEFYDTDKNFYIVQELASGGELYDELAKHGKLAESDVATLMKHALSCVKYLADNSIVHRDINLENIMLEKAGQYDKLKLIDFGLAAKVEAGIKLTEMAGKARYLAPEVLGDDGYGLKYDVWSCGVISFVLLTGEFPFEADSDFDVYKQIVHGYDCKDNDPSWGTTSDQAKDFIAKLLTFEEASRPTAEEALKHPWITGFNKGPVVPDPSAASVWVAHKNAKSNAQIAHTDFPEYPKSLPKNRPRLTLEAQAYKTASPSPRKHTTQPLTVLPPMQKVWSRHGGRVIRMHRRKSIMESLSPLDCAAQIIQSFLRNATLVLSLYRNERMAWEHELKDVERRRSEQLAVVQQNLEFEKRNIAVSMALKECKNQTVRQSASANLQLAAVAKGNLRIARADQRSLEKSVTLLFRENTKLRFVNPMKAQRMQKLQLKVKTLEEFQRTWKVALRVLLLVKNNLETEIENFMRNPSRPDTVGDSSNSSGSSSGSGDSDSDSSDSDVTGEDKNSLKALSVDLPQSSVRERFEPSCKPNASFLAVDPVRTSHTSKKKTLSFATNTVEPSPKKSTRTSKSASRQKGTKNTDGSYKWKDHLGDLNKSAPAQLASSGGAQRRSSSDKIGEKKLSKVESLPESSDVKSYKKIKTSSKKSKTSKRDKKEKDKPSKNHSRRRELTRTDSAPSVMSHDSTEIRVYDKELHDKKERSKRRSSISVTDTVPGIVATDKKTSHDKRMSYSWQDHSLKGSSSHESNNSKKKKRAHSKK